MSTQRRFSDLLRHLLVAALAGLAGLALPVFAQDADPPGRAGWLSELQGQVWVYAPDTGEWVAAQPNQPLTTGDRVATDGGARAEIQIGSTVVRLDAATELEVVRLDDDRVSLALANGSALARIRDAAAAGQFEVATDEGRFLPLGAGTFRFERASGRSDLTVYNGRARYEGPNSGLPLDAGQHAQFWIDSAGVAQYATLAPANDAFFAWSGDRDRRQAPGVTERYVSPEMTGAASLDGYGRWEQNVDYGPVWIPTAVAVDWAPYSHGHWAWVRPWGWTWVDDAPWGFAPFHYGRWVYARDRWCWSPGARVARPVYAPALVAWVGGPPRGNVSVRVSGGPVGWFPLGPREVYVPSYRVSPRYAERINITQVSNVTAIRNVFNNPQAPRDFENRRFPRAITVVPAAVLAERRPVAPAAAQWRQTPWVRDVANGPGRVAPLLTPPVAAPAIVARIQDRRAVQPPPGAAQRPAYNDPAGGMPRDRFEDTRQREQRDAPPRPGQANFPQATMPMQPGPAGAAPQANGGRPAGVPPGQARAPWENNPAADAERAGRPRPPGFREGAAPPLAPLLPAVPAPQQVRPAAPPAEGQGPMMRALPIRRGADEERRSEERRPGPFPVQPPQAQQPQRLAPVQPQAQFQPSLPTQRPVAPQFEPSLPPQRPVSPQFEPSLPPPRPAPPQLQPRPAEPAPVARPAPPPAVAPPPPPVQARPPAPVVAPPQAQQPQQPQAPQQQQHRPGESRGGRPE